jgi:hypothetical protein
MRPYGPKMSKWLNIAIFIWLTLASIRCGKALTKSSIYGMVVRSEMEKDHFRAQAYNQLLVLIEENQGPSNTPPFISDLRGVYSGQEFSENRDCKVSFFVHVATDVEEEPYPARTRAPGKADCRNHEKPDPSGIPR